MTLVQNLTAGTWTTPDSPDSTAVHNPSTGEVIARTPSGMPEDVDRAVVSATEAYKEWSRTSPVHRAGLFFRYRQILEDNFEDLAALVTRENGKTLEEARGDVRRGIEVIEFACGIPHLLKGETLPNVARDIDAATTREPIGVCAGITPFNFPAMVPMWMFPLAVACGNTFIFKPSEKVPLTAVRLAELFQEAGFPGGVLNVVHGGRDVVNPICEHPGIAAISFVGSSAVAKRVYTSGCAAGKRVQAAGGAKNVLVVMPDADPVSALNAVMGSAFGCAGQRCMAGSLLFAVDDGGEFKTRLIDAMNALSVTDTSTDPNAGMGPVIDGSAKERVENWISKTNEEGGDLARDGRSVRPEKGFFVGPTLFDSVQPGMTIFDQEVFGPVLAMARPKDLDEAIGWANRCGYGNGATIFTSSGAAARRFVREIPCGMVGVNVGVPAPMAQFSFSGWGNSFFGDLHVQGAEGVLFYTRQKTVLTRWPSSSPLGKESRGEARGTGGWR